MSNLLSRLNIGTFDRGRQGVARRLDLEQIRLLDLVAHLGRVGVPAIDARRLLAEPAIAPGLRLLCDDAAHRTDLDARLASAAERIVPRRRGRPPRRP